MELPREWVEKAEFFRKEAERYLNEGVYWIVCFNAQQAVELYIKALQLAIMGVHDFTHDISRLLAILSEIGIKVPESLYPIADSLTPHYTMARYPGRKPIVYDRATGERCINYMERIIGWIANVIEEKDP